MRESSTLDGSLIVLEEQLTDMEDAVTAEVEAALDAEEFDVLDFFAGANLPTKDVTLYRDADAGFKLAEILEREAEAAKKKQKEEGLGLTDEEGYVDEDLITELHDRLLASAVTFHLRALSPETHKEIRNELTTKHNYKFGVQNDAYNIEYNYTVIAQSIQSVTAANGKVDTKPWTVERVEAFNNKTLDTEFNRLFEAAFEINFIGDAIDKAVNADF